MFIATANDLRGIPPPLRDRMEIIPIPGYTIEDKIPIANKHLFPKQLKLHGLNNTNLQVTDEAFKFLGINAVLIIIDLFLLLLVLRILL